jgi:hypothetical protein
MQMPQEPEVVVVELGMVGLLLDKAEAVVEEVEAVLETQAVLLETPVARRTPQL